MAVFHNLVIRLMLRSAAARNGHPPEITKLLHNPAAFSAFTTDKLTPMLNADPVGAEFLTAQNVRALPAGWFEKLLNLFLTNFPQILADIIAVLNLFPHAPMQAMSFNPFDIAVLVGKIIPNIGDIWKDAAAGMSLTDLITKYGDTELKLFQEIVAQFAH